MKPWFEIEFEADNPLSVKRIIFRRWHPGYWDYLITCVWPDQIAFWWQRARKK
jgi:hypothetical protein